MGPDREILDLDVDYDQPMKSIKEELRLASEKKLNKRVSDIIFLDKFSSEDVNSQTPRTLSLRDNQMLWYIPDTSAKKSFPTFEKSAQEAMLEALFKNNDPKVFIDALQTVPNQKFRKLMEEDNDINALLSDEEETSNIMAQMSTLENKYFFSIMIDNNLNNIEHNPVGLQFVSRYINKISDALDLSSPMDVVDVPNEEGMILGRHSLTDVYNNNNISFCNNLVTLVKAYVYLKKSLITFEALDVCIEKLNERLDLISSRISDMMPGGADGYATNFYQTYACPDVCGDSEIQEIKNDILRGVASFLYKSGMDIKEAVEVFNEYTEYNTS